MNPTPGEAWPRPLAVGLGAAAIAGVATAVVPQHAVSIARLLVAAVLVTVGLRTLAHALPGERPTSAFEHRRRRRPVRPDPPGLAAVRAGVREPPLPEAGGELGPGAARRLRAVAATRLARVGLDLDDPEQEGAARAAVSPATWAALTGEPPLPGRRRRLRPRPAGPGGRAEIVHAVLDDLDGVALGGPPAAGSPDPSPSPGAP